MAPVIAGYICWNSMSEVNKCACKNKEGLPSVEIHFHMKLMQLMVELRIESDDGDEVQWPTWREVLELWMHL